MASESCFVRDKHSSLYILFTYLPDTHRNKLERLSLASFLASKHEPTLQAMAANNGLGWKRLARPKHASLFVRCVNWKMRVQKCFISLNSCLPSSEEEGQREVIDICSKDFDQKWRRSERIHNIQYFQTILKIFCQNNTCNSNNGLLEKSSCPE